MKEKRTLKHFYFFLFVIIKQKNNNVWEITTTRIILHGILFKPTFAIFELKDKLALSGEEEL